MIGWPILFNVIGQLLHFTSLILGSCSILSLWLSFSSPRFAAYALVMLASATAMALGLPQRERT